MGTLDADSADLKLWERQLSDTDDSWTAFVSYRDMPTPRRLIRFGPYPTGKLAEWFRAHNWAARVNAYDNHLDAIRREEREALLAQHEREIMTEHLVLLSEARELVARELSKYLTSSREGTLHGLLKPSELTKLFEMVLKSDRLLKDQPTERVATQDLSKLTLEELRKLEEIHKKLEI